VDALKIVADEIKMTLYEVFCLYTGCSDSIWSQLIDDAETVGKILKDTSHDNYALVKLNGCAEKNFWRNTEVRGAAQAQLTLETPWAKIKAVLSYQWVDTAEKFDTAISELTPEDTPKILTKRQEKTIRRPSNQIDKFYKCTKCNKCYGANKNLQQHIRNKHQ
jgi:hypothetical protein